MLFARYKWLIHFFNESGLSKQVIKILLLIIEFRMFQNLKLFIKYNIPFFFIILKAFFNLIRSFKNIFNLVIVEFLSIFNIQLNIQANPLININKPIIINLSGFDHVFSIKFLNYFYSKKKSKIYNLKK